MNIVIGLATLLTLSSVLYNKNRINNYKKDLEKEKLISFFSQTRMDLIRMVHMKEIDVNSNFFKYIFSVTSHSVRALYYYENKAEALNNINIIKNSYSFLINQDMKNECKLLNNEQKQMLSEVNYNVLKIYLEAHYIEKLIFEVCFKLFKNYTVSRYEKISKFYKKTSKNLPYKIRNYIENLNSNLQYSKNLDETSTCFSC